MGTLANIKVEPCEVYWASTNLGFTQGDVTISGIGPDLVDVQSHQTGSTVMTQIFTGHAPKEVTVLLEEVNAAQIKRFLNSGLGATYTPGGGTDIEGIGSSKQFDQISTYADKLYFKPVGSADNTGDWFFWKAVPVDFSVVKSGENVETMEVTFRCFPDLSLTAELQWGGYGDHTQAL